MNTDFKYTMEYYRLLSSNAEVQTIDGVELTVYRGATTKLFRSMGISQSYYSKIIGSLKDLGCITLIKRGARGVDSIVALHHEPSEMEFLIRTASPLTNSPQAARLSERVADVEKQLGGLIVVDAVKNLDERLKKLERKLRED